MRIVFFGTPDFAVPAFQSLENKHEILAVFTQPDRPSGRGNKPTPSPVKKAAIEKGIQVHQPQTLKLDHSRDLRRELKGLNPDVFVVVAYGMMLPRGLLRMPIFGCINIHASLLPKYRGASPIHAALLNGDKETGISIIQMDEGIDTGDVLLRRAITIAPDERFTELNNRMAQLGAECIMSVLDSPNRIGEKQDDSRASYAPIIKRSDGLINWCCSVEQINNQIRAYDPWPGTYTLYNGKPLKIWGMTPLKDRPDDSPPGTVVVSSPTEGLLIKAGDGLCKITMIQNQGGNQMSTETFLRGNKIEQGTILTL